MDSVSIDKELNDYRDDSDELLDGEYSDSDYEKTNNELTAYDIAVFYNTYNLSALMKWWGKKLIVPDFQRSYIWNQKQASEFVDSILRGLPVPSMFFYDDTENNQLLVIDGQQRLTSLYKYIEEKKFNDKPFKLIGDIHSGWENRDYDNLKDNDRERLNDTLLNITVMRQLRPNDGQSSMYLAFQRINTGGRSLTPQEIRMAVSYGPLSKMVSNLAEDPIFNKWPFLRTEADRKNNNYSRIQELIVRFWVLLFSDIRPLSGTIRSSLDWFFSNNKDFDMPSRRIMDVKYFSKKELSEAFCTLYYMKELDEECFVPDTRPTSIFFESVWIGIALRVREGKEVSTELIKSKILKWKETIGDERFSSLFKARRSSSIESINARISETKQYFLEDSI